MKNKQDRSAEKPTAAMEMSMHDYLTDDTFVSVSN